MLNLWVPCNADINLVNPSSGASEIWVAAGARSTSQAIDFVIFVTAYKSTPLTSLLIVRRSVLQMVRRLLLLVYS
ncbi:hypothetical protein PILCRDRAFT_828461 [Piloderma croceum F 1598]|uniref:Uncharacterized protein n=1 Tax=Piloderma croceum (strain F 1598) TaxID=765440 RepID=A0A0C3F2Q1_PILCF|nr:hypothetical protein PILCRDRAFT_828461 [Piloderma croceum F 1598]